MSLDQLLSAVEMAEKEKAAAEKLDNTPPKVLVSKVPAVLVTIDGEPRLKKIEKTDLMQVVNTPFFIAMDSASKSYYLKAGQYWTKAEQVAGPWKLTDQAPTAAIAAAEGKDTAGLNGLASVAQPEAAEVVPEVLVSTEPAELFVLDGDAEFQVIPDTNLLYVSNTDRDVFLELGSQSLYILVSGRWYTAKSKEGPWTYVPSRELPADFAKIPPGSPKSNVLASIPDTDEAKEAIANASIPETAAVNRDEAKLEVTYDGEPKFESVEGTAMEYGVNTSYSVIHAQKKYYCCDNAVWFESDSPNGPWTVCVSVAKEIYTIPPSALSIRSSMSTFTTPRPRSFMWATLRAMSAAMFTAAASSTARATCIGPGMEWSTIPAPRPMATGSTIPEATGPSEWPPWVRTAGLSSDVAARVASSLADGGETEAWSSPEGPSPRPTGGTSTSRRATSRSTGMSITSKVVASITSRVAASITSRVAASITSRVAASTTAQQILRRPPGRRQRLRSARVQRSCPRNRPRRGTISLPIVTETWCAKVWMAGRVRPPARPTGRREQPAARMNDQRSKELDNQLKARNQGDARTQQSVQNRGTQQRATTTPSRPAATPRVVFRKAWPMK